MKSNTIKSWAEDDRPREKLLSKGISSLSNAELLAIIIGSGSREQSALELCKFILSENQHDLNKIANLTVNDLVKFKGIGEAKAISIVASMELGRRRKTQEKPQKTLIETSKDAYDILYPHLMDLNHEQFWIILLKKNLELIKIIRISTGGVSGTLVDQKIILKHAIENLSTNVILAHNHPSGNLDASQADIDLTKKIKSAASLLDIEILDHIIFTNNGYSSVPTQD